MLYALQTLMEILKVTKWKKIPLVVMTEADYQYQRDYADSMLAEREALFRAVEGVCMGESPCTFCEDFKACQREGRGAVIPHCDGWWPTDIFGKENPDEPCTAEAAAEELA